MPTRTFPAVALSLASVLVLHAQDVGELPAFEAVSIRETTALAPWSPSAPDRFVRRNVTLAQLARFGYDLTALQIHGGPPWRESREFDVSAVAGDAVSTGTMRLMVRRMLAERFAFRAHLETREMEVYELLRAREDGSPGEGLRPTVADCEALEQAFAARRQPGAPARFPCGTTTIFPSTETGVMRRVDTGQRMSDFASSLQAHTGRFVVDRTGLSGRYDIELRSEMPRIDGILGEPGPETAEPGMSIFTALEEQLGLKLEPARRPVEVLVIDAAELPTPN